MDKQFWHGHTGKSYSPNQTIPFKLCEVETQPESNFMAEYHRAKFSLTGASSLERVAGKDDKE